MTLELSAATFQNEYLPTGGTDVNAVVTVTGRDRGAPGPGDDAAGGRGDAAEVIIVDVSGSMQYPPAKLAAAKTATMAAIDCLRDGVLFGVIAGTDRAHRLYPAGRRLVPATATTRTEAKAAVQGLSASGGTAIGRWLTLAKTWFALHHGAIRHAILLTDGRNEGETEEAFAAALARCEGAFQCDCRGIGVDWSVAELRRVATTLLGTVDIVARPEELPADFDAMMRHAMAKAEADVRLRLWLPRDGAVLYVKQVSPTIEDLTVRGVRLDDRTTDFPTGAWGDETRDYHLCIVVPPHSTGEEMLAGRVSLIVDDQVVTTSLVKAVWTDDVAMSSRINAHVADYTGQAELAAAIAEGLDARGAGDVRAATIGLGRAAQLAAASGHDGTLRLLSRIVDIDDAATGTVRLKEHVDQADEMALDTRSTRTIRVTD